MRVAIYTRLSEDPDGTSTATARQEADCRQLVEGKGWSAPVVYQDNDVSAFQRRVRRPEFERLLMDVANGEFDVVVAWRSDRLVRQPRDLERFLDACDMGKAHFLSCTEPEFQGASGLLILRMLIAFASHESGVKSERVARKCRERAEQGLPPNGGSRMFGYDATGMHSVPAEADLVRECVRRILAGESIGSVADYLNEVSAPKFGGKRWSQSMIRRYLSSPRLCGLRFYKGQILGPGGLWDPIIDEPTWRRLQVMLKRPAQRERKRYLLGGLMRCGKCGAVMFGARKEYRVYICPSRRNGGCGGVGIKADLADQEITERLLHRLSGPGLDQVLAQLNEDDGSDLLERLQTDENALEQLAKDHYVEHLLSRPEYLAARSDLEDRVRATKQALSKATGVLSELPRGEDELRAAWTKRAIPWRQALIRAVVEDIVVEPANRNGHASLDRVKVTWRA